MPREREYADYEWLVATRSEVQALALRLYGFLKDNRRALLEDEKRRSVTTLLIGAVFSLWRAVFLFPEPDNVDQVADRLDKAQRFLESMIWDNTILYKDDKANASWTFGYYMNNTDFRLSKALSLIDQAKLPGAVSDHANYVKTVPTTIEAQPGHGDPKEKLHRSLNLARAIFETVIA